MVLGRTYLADESDDSHIKKGMVHDDDDNCLDKTPSVINNYHIGLNYTKHKLHNHHCKSKGNKEHGSTLLTKLVTTTRSKDLGIWATTKGNAKR